MRAVIASRYALCVSAGALLAACGLLQQTNVTPIANRIQSVAPALRHNAQKGAWQLFRIVYGAGAEGIVRRKSAFWVADSEGSSPAILRVNPDGKQRVFKVVAVPGAITADREGALWFTNQRLLNTICRFDTKSAGVLSVTLSDDTNGGIILGGDGNIWVLQVSHVARVTPQRKVREYATPGETFGESGLVWANGKIWFLVGAGFASLDPASGQVETYRASLEDVGGVVATNGSLYVMGGDLVQLALKTKAVTTYARPARFFGAPSPQSLAVAPDGSLWYAAQRVRRPGGRVIGGGFVRFDVSTHHFTPYASPEHAPWNWGVTVTPDGKIWGTAGYEITVLSP
ncbi:MAG TPA: hypothetical protein VGI19_11940 [Candidatus Cybelea sp.]